VQVDAEIRPDVAHVFIQDPDDRCGSARLWKRPIGGSCHALRTSRARVHRAREVENVMSHGTADSSKGCTTIRPNGSGDLNVVQDGRPDAPPLLLIHGLAGSTAWWDSVVPMLTRDFRLIRVDLRGHGKSPSPRQGYDTASHARGVAAALDSLGINRFSVVGHSTGGYVATALAEQRRDAVVALTVIDSGPSPDAIIPQGLLSELALLPLPGRLLWRLQSEATIRKLLRAGAFFREIDIPRDVIESIQGMTHRAFAGTARGSLQYIRQCSVPDRLAALGIPVQVIFGVEDRRYRSSSATDEYRAIPDVRIDMLEGVGHTPMLEDPQSTTRLLTTFMADVADRNRQAG
jgi:pimeloyl-ACP methyl ester carboxylesterase